MKCENCNSESNYFDDKVGETICSDCGYVMVSNILEDTLSVRDFFDNNSDFLQGNKYISRNPDRGQLGSKFNTGSGNTSSYIKRLFRTQQRFRGRQEQSLSRGYLEINMVLSSHLPNSSLKERAHYYYKKLFFDRVMSGFPIDIRACAISLIVLRENGIPITIAELAKKNNVHPAKVSKCAKKIARSLKIPFILHSMPIGPWVDKVTYDMIMDKYNDIALKQAFKRDATSVVNYIHNYVTNNNITFTKSYMASSLWITVCLRSYGNMTEFTQQEIGNACNCTSVSLRNRNKELLAMLGLTKKCLARLTVEQFIAGVRYE